MTEAEMLAELEEIEQILEKVLTPPERIVGDDDVNAVQYWKNALGRQIYWKLARLDKGADLKGDLTIQRRAHRVSNLTLSKVFAVRDSCDCGWCQEDNA